MVPLSAGLLRAISYGVSAVLAILLGWILWLWATLDDTAGLGDGASAKAEVILPAEPPGQDDHTLEWYSVIWRKEAALPELTPGAETDSAGSSGDSAPAGPTPPPYKVVGTIVEREARYVVLRDDAGRQILKKKGDNLGDFEITSISSAAIGLKQGARSVTLSATPPAAPPVGGGPSIAAPATNGASLGSAADASPRASSAAAPPESNPPGAVFSVPPTAFDGARVRPLFDSNVEGNIVGLEVVALKPESALARAGVRQGDILSRLNGVPLGSVVQLVNLEGESRRTGKPIVLEATREGRAMTITLPP